MKRLGSGYPNLVVSGEKVSATDTSHIVDSDPRVDSTLIHGKPPAVPNQEHGEYFWERQSHKIQV
jgi:hypothetical protein